MITVLVLLGFVVLRVLAICGIAYLLIPPGRLCPACGAATVALERRGIARLLPGVVRRWCVACGWSWFRRRLAAQPTARAAAGSARPADRSGLRHP